MTIKGQEMKSVGGYSNEVIEYVDWINVMVYGGGDGEMHTPMNYVISSSHYWLNIRKVNPAKVVLGIPFYGRPEFYTYEKLIEMDSNVPFMNEINGIHYNGIELVKKKTRFALDNLGGVMIWEVAQDSLDKKISLLSAIYEEFVKFKY